jgi:predicted metal-dependent HD superfamily phosphohydrolase
MRICQQMNEVVPTPRLSEGACSGWVRIAKILPKDILNDVALQILKPNRHYHDVLHIGAIWDTYVRLTGQEVNPSFMYAAVFHDYIYDVRNPKKHNEFLSNFHFCMNIPKTGLDEESSKNVSLMILATSDHWDCTTEMEKLFCDIDLACGLAVDYDDFEHNSMMIKLEHDGIDDEVYMSGRNVFLRGVLEKRRIFRSMSAPKSWEQRVRDNIKIFLSKNS